MSLPFDIGAAISWALNFLQNIIMGLLKETIFKSNPELAVQFSGAISTLTFLTAVYLLLVLVSSLRKIIGYLIALGWILLILAMTLSIIGAPSG
ncbi:MAG TPA: hypothetical protein EYH40_03030 [Desulfurococcales archaeon]|nr:hypothetical protein [Desulfurococcales archaeon]